MTAAIMNLVKTEFEHLTTLKSWFSDKESSYNWCGPGLRYPYTNESFLEDIHWEKMPTYSLVDDANKLISFGQYYEKFGRCHLARLAVSPRYRSKGIGRDFINSLMKIGLEDLELTECSLFVVSSNEKAINCYKSLHFTKKDYPQGQQYLSDISFMLRKVN